MKCLICRAEVECPCADLKVERGDWPLGNPARYYNETPPWMWSDEHTRPILTTGVFDLFHPGHVAILRHAEALARSGRVRLIVGVDTDKRATRTKRVPVMPFECRKSMVEAIVREAIVVPLEASIETLIEQYNPCLFVKGSDWDIYYLRRKVYKYGMGATVLRRDLPYSTTDFINKIVERHSTYTG